MPSKANIEKLDSVSYPLEQLRTLSRTTRKNISLLQDIMFHHPGRRNPYASRLKRLK